MIALIKNLLFCRGHHSAMPMGLARAVGKPDLADYCIRCGSYLYGDWH